MGRAEGRSEVRASWALGTGGGHAGRTDGREMTDADSAVRLQERLHTLLSREDVTGAEKMKALRTLALFCPSDGLRWAALSGSWPERAASFLHRALVLAPGDFRLHVNFSNWNLKTGGARAAAAGLKRAALLEPGFSRCYGSLAGLMTTTARRWTYQSCAWQSGGAGEAALGQIEPFFCSAFTEMRRASAVIAGPWSATRPDSVPISPPRDISLSGAVFPVRAGCSISPIECRPDRLPCSPTGRRFSSVRDNSLAR